MADTERGPGVSWKFYVGRKRINPKKWVEARNLKNYEDFVAVLKVIGINAPARESVVDLFPEPEPEPVQLESIGKSRIKRAAASKKGAFTKKPPKKAVSAVKGGSNVTKL